MLITARFRPMAMGLGSPAAYVVDEDLTTAYYGSAVCPGIDAVEEAAGRRDLDGDHSQAPRAIDVLKLSDRLLIDATQDNLWRCRVISTQVGGARPLSYG